MTIFSKPTLYDGNKAKYFKFVADFELAVKHEVKLSEQVFNPVAFKAHIDKLRKRQTVVALMPPYGDPSQETTRLRDLERAKDNYEKEKKRYDELFVKLQGMIQTSITETVYHSIKTDMKALLRTYETEAENPFFFDNYPAFRAMWKALEKNYCPHIPDALSHGRYKFEFTKEFLVACHLLRYAVNQYVNEISVYPVLDNLGNTVIDETGRATYHTADHNYMRNILLNHIEKSTNAAKVTLHTQWIATHCAYTDSLRCIVTQTHCVAHTVNVRNISSL